MPQRDKRLKLARTTVESYGHDDSLSLDLKFVDKDGDTQLRSIQLSFHLNGETPVLVLHTSHNRLALAATPIAFNELKLSLE